MRGLFAVMEDELAATLVAPADEQVERVQELEEQVAQAEVAEGQAEVAEMADIADEAVTAIEELADVAEVMSDSVEGDGEGLTEDAAEIAEVAVEAICARLGYKPAKKLMPSLEAFGSTSSRVEATKYALEGIGDTMKKIWEAIKGFFNRIWEAIKGLWNRLFDASTKVAARAKKLEEKAAAAKKDGLVANPEKKYNAVKFCKAFNSKDVAGISKAAVDVLSSHFDVLQKQAAFNASLVVVFEKAEKAETEGEVISAMGKISTDKTLDGVTFAFGTTFNRASFELTSSEIDVKEAEGKVVALDVIENVIEAAKQFQIGLDKSKADVSKIEATIKKGIAAADKLSKEAGTSAEIGKMRSKAFKTGQTALITINSKLPALGLKAASVALDFAAVNLAGFKAK
jgi:hypothetical protein